MVEPAFDGPLEVDACRGDRGDDHDAVECVVEARLPIAGRGRRARAPRADELVDERPDEGVTLIADDEPCAPAIVGGRCVARLPRRDPEHVVEVVDAAWAIGRGGRANRRHDAAIDRNGRGDPGVAGTGFDPEALALECVRREPQPAAAGAGEAFEVDVDAGSPQACERHQRERRVVDDLVGVPEAGDHGCRLAVGTPGERRQRVPGSQLGQHDRAVGQDGGEAIGEAHRVAEVIDPVLRIGRLLGRDPRAREVRDVRDRRRRERDLADRLEERRQDRIEQRAVPGGHDRDQGRRHVLWQRCVERLDVGRPAGDDAFVAGVDGGQRQR